MRLQRGADCLHMIQLMPLHPNTPSSLAPFKSCTMLQTDNHTSTPPLSFLQAGYPSCHPTNSVKALKAEYIPVYIRQKFCGFLPELLPCQSLSVADGMTTDQQCMKQQTHLLATTSSNQFSSSKWPLTHTHPFNGPLSRTTRVRRYQKGKISLDFTEARDSEWQWHQLGHMQVYTSLQTDNHASTPPLKFF